MTRKPKYPREIVPGITETRRGAFSINSEHPEARLWRSLENSQREQWLSIRAAAVTEQQLVAGFEPEERGLWGEIKAREVDS